MNYHDVLARLPEHEEIERQIQEFLGNGGQIEKVEAAPRRLNLSAYNNRQRAVEDKV